MEQIIQKDKKFADTLSVAKIIGKRVISPSGFIVGKVLEVRIDNKKYSIEGIFVRNNIHGKIYFGMSYFKSISTDAVFLLIEPSILLKQKKVLAHDGKFIGKVKTVSRVDETNDVRVLEVKKIFRKPFFIKPRDIDSYGKSIILKKDYDAKKNTKGP